MKTELIKTINELADEGKTRNEIKLIFWQMWKNHEISDSDYHTFYFEYNDTELCNKADEIRINKKLAGNQTMNVLDNPNDLGYTRREWNQQLLNK